jgi:hypothetical protein
MNRPWQIVMAALVLAAGPVMAQQGGKGLSRAEVTVVVNDVKVLPDGAQPKPAQVSDVIEGKTGLATGLKSRAELVFTDKTVARLGANTLFSFEKGTRNMDLKNGTMLLQVPKNAGGATIRTAAVTAAITGTTVLMEHAPGQMAKLIVLEGTVRLFLPGRVGESILVEAGHMVILPPGAKTLPAPVPVDLRRLVRTSRLLDGFGDTGSGSVDPTLIDEEIVNQQQQLADGRLLETNLIILGEGSEVIVADSGLLGVLDQFIAGGGGVPIEANQTGNSSPYSLAPLITTPNPYVILPSTVITFNPTITTSGVTHQGGLYNVSAFGPPSNYLFGSTSLFDTLSDFNNVDGSDKTVFRFSNLVLAGTPSHDGAGKDLVLVGMGGINTSGTFTWTATYNDLALITEAGNISLNSGFTYNNAGSGDFFAYARGTGGNLTLATGSVYNMNGGDISLLAEGTVQVNGQVSNAEAFEATAGDNVLIGGSVQANKVDIRAGLLNNAVTFNYSEPPFSYIGANPSISVEAPQINVNSSADFTGFSSAYFHATVGDLEAYGDVLFANLVAAGSINNYSGGISGGSFLVAGGDITSYDDLGAGQISAGGDIVAAGDLFSLSVSAGGNVTVFDDLRVQNLTSGESLTVYGYIRPHVSATATTAHVFNIFDLTAASGIAFQGNHATLTQPATSGRRLSVTTQTTSPQVFEPLQPGPGYINGQIDLRGGDGNGYFPQAGNGGYFSFTHKGNIQLTNNYQILAGPGNPYSSGGEGNGGTILLTTDNQFIMDGTYPGTALEAAGLTTNPSKSGGLVSILSKKTSGTGIQISDSSQILAITTAAATTGSRIELRTQGADIIVNGGLYQVGLDTQQTTAKVNQVLIDTGGTTGSINLNQMSVITDLLKVRGQSVTLNNSYLNASTVKIYTTGSLNFGSGNTILANSIVLASPTITVGSPIIITGSPTVNVYSGSALNVANFTGGTPTINNQAYGLAPAF